MSCDTFRSDGVQLFFAAVEGALPPRFARSAAPSIFLLAGDGSGAVTLFENVGDRKKAEFSEAIELVAEGDVTYGSDAPEEPTRGVRSKVCAVDWNGDGKLDLLVGDFATQKPDLPEPTPEEKQQHAKIREEMESLQKEFSELFPKVIGRERVTDAEEAKKLQEQFRKLSERRSELYNKLPPEYESHGWVWLFVRK